MHSHTAPCRPLPPRGASRCCTRNVHDQMTHLSSTRSLCRLHRVCAIRLQDVPVHGADVDDPFTLFPPPRIGMCLALAAVLTHEVYAVLRHQDGHAHSISSQACVSGRPIKLLCLCADGTAPQSRCLSWSCCRSRTRSKHARSRTAARQTRRSWSACAPFSTPSCSVWKRLKPPPELLLAPTITILCRSPALLGAPVSPWRAWRLAAVGRRCGIG